MNSTDELPWTARLADYERQADALFAALKKGDDQVRWAFKWEHPRFRGQRIDAVHPDSLGLDDARMVVARRYGFESWADLAGFAQSCEQGDPSIRTFEAAADAVVAGDLPALQTMLRDDPDLARARSKRRHHATLLHYLGANGVEGGRQRTPANAVEVAKTLLEAGAEVDALADLYDSKCTTMSLLVSSKHPAKAGLQVALAETLLDHGAAFTGPGSNRQSAVRTALAFGYLATAQALVRRGAKVEDLAEAAGLGRRDDVLRLLPLADSVTRHIALSLAAQLGHADVVRLLLDAGEDPNRSNPEGFHSHSTPLHQAVWGDHLDVVRLLAARGARLDLRDTLYDGTPLDWAVYGGRTRIADDLRGRGAPERAGRPST